LSAHVDAVTALNGGYEEIKKSLDAFLNYINQSSETRLIAQSLRKKMYELERTFLTLFYDILIRINSVSKVLQKQNMNLSVTVKLTESLMAYVSEKRDCFEEYEPRAKEKSHIYDYEDAYKRGSQCSSTIVFF
jgi:hypothetical protein